MHSISLCMITKNEEKFLPKCLDSVKQIVDEVIIADTGSIDKTKEIAKKFNAKVFDFKWQDDFSKARNFSLSKATKDWILVLDADEAIAGKDLDKIKKLTEDKSIFGYQFIRRNYINNNSISDFVPNDNIYEEYKDYLGWYPSKLVRLFQNKKGIEFEGIVHELAEPSIEKLNGKIKIVNFPIHHFGDVNPIAYIKRREFYLKLCEERIKQKPEDIRSLFELGLLYKELGSYDKAINTLKKLINIDKKFSAAYYELGIIFEKQKNYDEAISYYKGAVDLKPKYSNALLGLGICYFRLGLLENAKDYFEKALEANPNNAKIYANLGAVYEKLGNYESAIKVLDIGIKLNPNNAMAFFNLGIAYEKIGNKEDAIKCYEDAARLNHKKKEQIKNKIDELKRGMVQANYSYSVNFK